MARSEATFGAGCFWCVQPIFIQLEGVLEVFPGYAGGHIKNPCYREVCQGITGHAEVIRVIYDSDTVDFRHLLEIFWFCHDPTSLNQQGNDIGEQYKSVIYYHNEEQKWIAERYKSELNESRAYSEPVVTEISPLTTFYKAEQDHHDYYVNNPEVAYCKFVIRPKVDRFRSVFKNRLKQRL